MSFLKDESGAVTVDWVVVTAAVVGLGLGAAMLVRNGSAELGGDVSNSLSSASVVDLGQLGAQGYYWFHGNDAYWNEAQVSMIGAPHSSLVLLATSSTDAINTHLSGQGLGTPYGAANNANALRMYWNEFQRQGLPWPDTIPPFEQTWQRVVDAKPCASSWNASEC